MQHSRFRIALGLWLLTTASFGSTAGAQEVLNLDTEHLHPAATYGAPLSLEGGEALRPWTFSMSLFGHYADTPLHAEDPAGARQAVLVGGRTMIEPGVVVGLPGGVAFEVVWPFVAQATGHPEELPAIAGTTLSGTGAGDGRLGLSFRHRFAPTFMLLAGARLAVPIGTADLASEGGTRLSPWAGVEVDVSRLKLRAQGGYRHRFAGANVGGAFKVEDEINVAGGLEVDLVGPLSLLAEVHSQILLGVARHAQNPAEGLAGVRVIPARDFEILAFGGFGVTRGYGTPVWRAGLGLRFYPHMHDADEDGVDDSDDECPHEAEDQDGFQDEDGCPDRDNDADGVPDTQDECPNEPGLGRYHGCPDPDADHDGVVDNDRCPDDAEDQDGFEDEDGCPEADNDNDGFEDGEDRCPNDAEDRDGFEDEDGCPEPDNDRDGVLDADDRCPREREDRDGFEDEDGCEDADNDGDGVPDREDGPLDPGGEFGVCRDMPETEGGRDARQPDGCPDGEVRVDVEARRIRVPPVYFDTNADVIQERSFDDLQYVAQIMEANDWIGHVEVQGHTDDRGGDEYNMDLSQRRAASVVRFLVEHGIDAARMTPHGYGRTRPPTEEDEPACRRRRSRRCRAAARRVVFAIDGIVDSSGAGAGDGSADTAPESEGHAEDDAGGASGTAEPSHTETTGVNQ